MTTVRRPASSAAKPITPGTGGEAAQTTIPSAKKGLPMSERPPAGWTRITVDGDVPLWNRDGAPVYVATRDTDLLLFLGVALRRFQEMEPREFVEFVTGGGRWPLPPKPIGESSHAPGATALSKTNE